MWLWISPINDLEGAVIHRSNKSKTRWCQPILRGWFFQVTVREHVITVGVKTANHLENGEIYRSQSFSREIIIHVRDFFPLRAVFPRRFQFKDKRERSIIRRLLR